jgi:leader peptidase (prepilin peptidase)/N-methyltransferase
MQNYLIFVWFFCVFLLGAVVGSGLNVCIYRIPYDKSFLWPSSHCGNCYQPIRWYDNIPLVSYWVLRGKCRTCKAPFSIRYFLVELFTGLGFAGLFYLDVVANAHNIRPANAWGLPFGGVPQALWFFWGAHALLLSLLIVTSMTDIDHMEIPLAVTVTGTLVGLVVSALCPWPWPNEGMTFPPPGKPGSVLPMGFHVWPLWRPDELPAWMPPGSWQLGLATGLAGVLAGMLILRGVRFLFGVGRGQEGLGLGDADLMMMAGAFVGWQVVLVAFFLSVFPALVIGVGQVILRGNQMMPFGPSLALGTLGTLYCWRWIGPRVQDIFFDSTVMLFLGGAGAVALLLISFVLRLIRGVPEDEVTAGAPPA